MHGIVCVCGYRLPFTQLKSILLFDHVSMKEYVIARPFTLEKTIVKDPKDDASFVM